MRGGAGGDLVGAEVLGLAEAAAARDQRVEVRARDAERLGGAAELEAVLAQRRDEAVLGDRRVRSGGGRAPAAVASLGGSCVTAVAAVVVAVAGGEDRADADEGWAAAERDVVGGRDAAGARDRGEARGGGA